MTNASIRVTGAGKAIIQTHYAHLIAYAWDLACYMSAFFIAIGFIFAYLSFKKTREYRKAKKSWASEIASLPADQRDFFCYNRFITKKGLFYLHVR